LNTAILDLRAAMKSFQEHGRAYFFRTIDFVFESLFTLEWNDWQPNEAGCANNDVLVAVDGAF
jgi:ATP-dependent RNA circularization protein (DNA/RNA ligase family)